MADYLVYWKDYWEKTDDPGSVIHDWHTDSKYFYTDVRSGDRLWVVVTGGPDHPREWRLLQRINIANKEVMRQRSEYGEYHFVGDDRSQLFDPEQQPDFAAILQLLNFASGRRISVAGRRIGLALQAHGHRRLSNWDVFLLEEYSRTLYPVPNE